MAFLDKVLQDSARYYDNHYVSLNQIWYGERGIFGGSTYLGYITISTIGNMTSFGTITSITMPVSCSNGYRGIFATNTITFYITISTISNANTFGTLIYNCTERSSGSNGIIGVFGSISGLSYVTIATIGDAVDFGGTLIRCGTDVGGCMTDGYKGVFGPYNQYIEYIIFSNKMSALDFGQSTANRIYCASTSNRIRGIMSCAESTIVLDYITIATTGNATDFGDATITRRTASACSNTIRSVFGSSTSINVLDYVTISTIGNATDFGDILSTIIGTYATACSGN